MSKVVKEFMNRVWGFDYQLQKAAGDEIRIKNLVTEASLSLQAVTMMAEDAMEHAAEQAVIHGMDHAMKELTRIERIHTHYVDTIAEYQQMYA